MEQHPSLKRLSCGTMVFMQPQIIIHNDQIIMPGLATAHSHAFQRALRGRTQRKATHAGSFWSWRGLMYQLAESIDPDDVFHISRFAFAELAMSGVTAVGEFHYVHHAPAGQPYADRVILADAVIRAAREVGIRITLIRTAYFRAGHNKLLEPAQKRFCDPSVDAVLNDVEILTARFRDDPGVRMALAAHSIRAVPLPQVVELADYARTHQRPFHMHVAEQQGEIDECLNEYGRRPVELLAGAGVLSPKFVAVHATHLTDGEIQAVGDARAYVCLCRTTERDLGDGLPRTGDLVRAGVKLCVGVDSHTCGDAFEEIRAVELDERARTKSRHAAAEGADLLQAATQHGYEAIGMADLWRADWVILKPEDPSISGVPEALLTDAVMFGATPRAVDEVIVGGKTIVQGGVHGQYDAIRQGYLTTLAKLELL